MHGDARQSRRRARQHPLRRFRVVVIHPARRRLLRVAAAALAVGCGAGPADPGSSPTLHTIAGDTMGTTYTVQVVAEAVAFDRAAVAAAIERRLTEIDARMSHYRTDSELVGFNRAATTAPYPLARETVELIADAITVSAATGGAFDVTVGPLVDAWGFGPAGRATTWPDEAELTALRASVGYERLEVDRVASTLRKRRPDLRLDLSAIAKGYAVDALASLLAADGWRDYLIEIGGELRGRGVNEQGEPWRVAIERPGAGASSAHRIIPLGAGAIATSGEYRNYYEHDGARVSHTIDPRTGRPVTHRLASVSVLAARCAIADARATALEVLGPDEGQALAEREDWAALFLVRDDAGRFRERTTPAFDRLVGLAPAAPEPGTRP